MEVLLVALLPLGERSIQLPEPSTTVWELSHNEMQWLFSGINFMKQKVKKFDKIEYFFWKIFQSLFNNVI